jgi:hypothetical protein
MLGNVVAADLPQHRTHPGIEILDGEDPERAALLKIVKNTVPDVRDKRAVLTIAGRCCTAKGFLNPIGFISDHMMMADF